MCVAVLASAAAGKADFWKRWLAWFVACPTRSGSSGFRHHASYIPLASLAIRFQLFVYPSTYNTHEYSQMGMSTMPQRSKLPLLKFVRVAYSSPSTCAPCSVSICTISSIPYVDATWSGVLPFLFFTSALALRLSNKRTVAVWPSDDARCNGVHPSVSSTFGFAPWSSNQPMISV
jgi:hypothetical protein